MKKRWFILLPLVILLAACGEGLSEEDAEKALEDAFQGEVEQANEAFCAWSQIDEVTELPENVVFKEVTCDKQGIEAMECTATLEENGTEAQLKMSFTITEDRLCSPKVQ
jgi:hypothetical protein